MSTKSPPTPNKAQKKPRQWQVLLALVMTLGSLELSAEPKPLAEQQLHEAENAFRQGYYDRCREQVADQDMQELAPELRARFALLKARLAAVFEDDESMNAWLNRLLQLEPAMKLNRYTDPPQLMEAWENIRLSAPDSANESPKKDSVPQQESQLREKSPLKRHSHEIVSLFPIGIGTFHHGEYTRGLLFTLLDVSLLHFMTQNKAPFADQDKKNPGDLDNRVQWFALAGLAASWGYQTHAILAADSGKNLASAETLRQVHAFMPFGLGQIQNGEYNKAFAFAAAEAVLFLYAGMEDDPDKQKLAYYLAWGTIFYGAFDGWYHYEPDPDQTGSYQLSPHLETSHTWINGEREQVTGYGASLSFKF